MTGTKWGAGAIAVLASVGLSQAMTVRPVNLDQMVHEADRVIVGRVLAAEDTFDQKRLPITVYRIRVEDAIKGEVGTTLEIRQLGHRSKQPNPETGRIFHIPGMPLYAPGESVLLLLNQDSRLGLTSPVGMMQGSFRLTKDKGGRELALNGVGNRGLLSGMEPGGAARGAGWDPSEFQRLVRDGGAIERGALVALIRSMVDEGRPANDR